MEFGGQQQHFVEHVAADVADGHDGHPCQQIGADEAADAADDDQNDKKDWHNPDLIGCAPNHVRELRFPVLQGGDDTGGGIEFRRGGRCGETLVDQRCDKGGQIAFGGGNAEDGEQGADNAGLIGTDVVHQTHEVMRIFFGKKAEGQFFYHGFGFCGKWLVVVSV